MDQENLCLRAGKCSNSNVGEQTLGNDNSVTGFSDQSKNVQATVTPTPVVTPTATPTPCQEDEPSTAEEGALFTPAGGPIGVQVCPPGEDEPFPNEETSGDQS